MSRFVSALLGRPRITLTTAVLLAAMGVLAWLTMPRLEDPEMADRWAIVLAPYPGADPQTVERTIVRAVEQELAQVAEIARIESHARLGVALFTLELDDAIDVDDVDRIWERVQRALTRAQRDFPPGVEPPQLDRDINDPESIVLAITGADALALDEAADRVERALLGVDQVARVTRIGDPGEQVTIALDPTVAHGLGVTRQAVADTLASRHVMVPAGVIDLDGRTASLRPDAEFRDLADIEATPIGLAEGSAVALGDVARVTRGPADPPLERMRFNGQVAVGLGVVPERPVDLVAFGRNVRRQLALVRSQLAPLEVHEVAFQPAHVERRLTDLGLNLLQSMAIVGGLLMLFMGLRMGLLVSLIVPLVTLSSLGLYAASGGVLHQMSIAALVIAIGMLVDNAIVVAEDVQTRLDAGAAKREAGAAAARALAAPLGSATGTTLAAFVPMWLAKGPVAEFTAALPIVIMLTLVLSYLFALFVTPTLAGVLKPSPSANHKLRDGLAAGLGALVVRRPKTILAGALVGVGLASYGGQFVEMSFFPHGDRNQLIVDISLPEGSDLDRIDGLSQQLERALRDRPEVTSVAAFVGRGAPHFYYNVATFPRSPHRAQLLVTTRHQDDVAETQRLVRTFARRELPEVSVAAQKLEQGPGIAAPVEVRIYGEDLSEIARSVEQVVRSVSSSAGTVDVRETMGSGVPAVRIRIDDATAHRHGRSRKDVVLALLGHTRGLEIGKLRTGNDPVPVLVRAPGGRRTSPELIASTAIDARTLADAIPLAELADTTTEWLPAAIHHRNRRRVASVLADIDDGHSYSQVMQGLNPKLAALALPAGVELELGGLGEGSSDANAAMAMALPFGLLLLVGILLLEFNSFRRVAIVLTTIPLAATGVVPGLLLARQPFGFMSTLGVTALAGVVVNNAIVLLDVADARVKSGAPLTRAIQHAVRARTRPILLTSITTMAGLLPLATSTSSLWPPLAWAMISGLAASTLLTLLVVPALYVVLMNSTRSSMLALTSAVVLGLSPTLLSQPARAQAPAPGAGATDAAPAEENSAAEQPIEAFDLAKALIAESGGLTADEVSRLARARSPQIRSAEAGASQALWDAKNAAVGFWPQIELFARYSRVNLIQNQLSGGFGSSTPTTTNPLVLETLQELAMIFQESEGFNVTQPVNQYSVGVNASLPLSSMFLQVWPSYRGTVGLAESQAVQAEVTEAVVDQQARSAFYGYARAVARRVVAEQAVKQAQAQAAQIKLFVDAGTSAPVDFMTATARLEQARGALAGAGGQVRIARNQLATLTGLPVSEVDGIAEPIVTLPREPKASSDELLARALQRRPELQALRKLVAAQEKLKTAQRNSGLPQLVLSASDLYAQPNPRVFPPNTDEFRNSWEVGASVVWQPNGAFAGYTATRKAAASVAKARADLASQEDAVRIEVVQAYENYISAVEMARASEAQLKAAEEAYRVRLAMYRVGAGVMVDLLNADLEVSQARLAHVNAALDARDALALLRRVAVLED